MAKTIKFNLIVDKKPIRDIKGLQENFCIDDILDFYQNGLLQKWLKVRGFDDYLKKIEKINKKKSIIRQLIEIFEITKSEKEIKEAIYSLQFWEQKKIELEKYSHIEIKTKNIINTYHNGYKVLKENILENKENMPFLKQTTKEIFNQYLELFTIDLESFCQQFKETVPLMIYALLMNENLKDYCFNHQLKQLINDFSLESSSAKNNIFSYLLEKEVQTAGTGKKNENNYESIANEDPVFILTEDSSSFNTIYPHGVYFYFYQKVTYYNLTKLKDYGFRMFKGVTDSYWKDLEITGTKVMVLSIPRGTYVRSANKPKEELSASDINGKFLLLDGLLYKSNTKEQPIIYMEI